MILNDFIGWCPITQEECRKDCMWSVCSECSGTFCAAAITAASLDYILDEVIKIKSDFEEMKNCIHMEKLQSEDSDKVIQLIPIEASILNAVYDGMDEESDKEYIEPVVAIGLTVDGSTIMLTPDMDGYLTPCDRCSNFSHIEFIGSYNRKKKGNKNE